MPSILGALARSRRDAQSHCLQRYLARKPKVSPIPCCSASRTRGPGPFEHRQHVCVCPRRPGRQRPPGTWLAGPSAGFEGMAEKCGAFTTWCWQAPRMRRSSSQRGYGKLRKQAGTRQAAELALGGLDYQLFRFGSAFERLGLLPGIGTSEDVRQRLAHYFGCWPLVALDRFKDALQVAEAVLQPPSATARTGRYTSSRHGRSTGTADQQAAGCSVGWRAGSACGSPIWSSGSSTQPACPGLVC
jgi:hypothetical protein